MFKYDEFKKDVLSNFSEVIECFGISSIAESSSNELELIAENFKLILRIEYGEFNCLLKLDDPNFMEQPIGKLIFLISEKKYYTFNKERKLKQQDYNQRSMTQWEITQLGKLIISEKDKFLDATVLTKYILLAQNQSKDYSLYVSMVEKLDGSNPLRKKYLSSENKDWREDLKILLKEQGKL